MQSRLAKFVRVYVIFMLSSLLANVTMEMIVPTPEKERIVAEHGWGHLSVNVRGIVVFYAVFSLVGSTIYFDSNLRSVEMGVSSLVLGFVLEFAFMKPEWVVNTMALQLKPGDIIAILVSAFYWYVTWGLPSYLIMRYLMGLKK